MPDKRSHRGPHPRDHYLFRPEIIEALRSAVDDFSLLLTRGYSEKGALKLVGDRYSLTQRQRTAVLRCSCSDQQLEGRQRRRVSLRKLRGGQIAIDGYNVLITIEAAISKAVIFKGRDGSFKDLASIHGTYRRVSETVPAVQLIGEFMVEHQVREIHWLLDSPVSNSGRLKKIMADIAEKNGWLWDIRLATNPDTELMKSGRVVATSDGVVLDGCGRWVNLAGEIVTERLGSAWIVDLCGPA